MPSKTKPEPEQPKTAPAKQAPGSSNRDPDEQQETKGGDFLKDWKDLNKNPPSAKP